MEMKSVRDINLVSSIMTLLLFKFPMINVSQKRSDRYTKKDIFVFIALLFYNLFLFILDLNVKKRIKNGWYILFLKCFLFLKQASIMIWQIRSISFTNDISKFYDIMLIVLGALWSSVDVFISEHLSAPDLITYWQR